MNPRILTIHLFDYIRITNKLKIHAEAKIWISDHDILNPTTEVQKMQLMENANT